MVVLVGDMGTVYEPALIFAPPGPFVNMFNKSSNDIVWWYTMSRYTDTHKIVSFFDYFILYFISNRNYERRTLSQETNFISLLISTNVW